MEYLAEAHEFLTVDELKMLDDLPLGNGGSTAVSVPVIIDSDTAINVPATAVEAEVFYQSIDQAHVVEMQAAASRIKERESAAKAGFIETGYDLIRVKNSIPGKFDQWLQVEFEFSKTTAWNYINVAEKFGVVPVVMQALPPSTAYKLAAKATPEYVRKAIVQEIVLGTTPSKEDVERRIADARRQAAEDERERKRTESEKEEAARRQSEDEQAWQVRLKGLNDAGMDAVAVLKEHKKWKTAMAEKERHKERRKKAKEQREEKRALAHEERRLDYERKSQAARDAAQVVRERFGSDYEAFRPMLTGISVHEFYNMLMADAA